MGIKYIKEDTFSHIDRKYLVFIDNRVVKHNLFLIKNRFNKYF
jgi:hypothetical protein